MLRALHVILIMLAVATAVPLRAQTSDKQEEEIIRRIKESDLNWFLGGHLQIANPQGEYRDSLQALGGPDVGIGFDFNLGYYFSPIPVAITFEGGVLFMGGESKEMYMSSGLFRDTINVSSTSAVIPLNVSVRFMPDIGHWVYPYVEGVIGMNINSSNFELSQQRFEEVRKQSDSRSDVAFNYGIGTGVSIKMADIVNLPASLQRIVFDVRMRYLFGGALDVSTVDLDINEGDPLNSTYSFRSASVNTSDMVFFNLGIAFQF